MQFFANDLLKIWWIKIDFVNIFLFYFVDDIFVKLFENVCYQIISFYTSTIKILQYFQKRVNITINILFNRDFWKVVIVTISEIFHVNFFSIIKLKKIEIKTIVFFVFIKILKHSNVDNIIIQFQKCNVIYFICHKISNSLDLFQNNLILQTSKNAIEKSQQIILKVQKLFQIYFSRTKIAYFFVCSIAQN